MHYLRFIFLVILISFYVKDAYSNVKIKYKVGNEIVTNQDILNEQRYLLFLRPSLKNLPNNEITKISENSLIREKIKKKEIDRIFKNMTNTSFVDEIKKSLFKFKNVKTEKEFIEITKKNNVNYDIIIEKMKYESLWNELILKKFESSIKINKKILEEKLISKKINNLKYEYNLSEIIFEIENNEKFQIKYQKIINFINNNDFKSAAIKYSISNSAKIGGQIGWVKGTLLSDKVLNNLEKLNIGSVTMPIKYPNGYLLLKINDKREVKNKIDINKELEELVNFERNRQLNQFSLLYYKKLKQNVIIDEY